MKMKSLKTQFIGAIAMVLVAAIAMGSSTYAWFAMNTQVEANGMQVKAVAEDGILIINELDDDTTTNWKSATQASYSTLVSLAPTSTANDTTWFHNKSDSQTDAKAGQAAATYETISSDPKWKREEGSGKSGTYYIDNATGGTTAEDVKDPEEKAYVLLNKFFIKSSSNAITIPSGEYTALYVNKVAVTGAGTSADLDASLRILIKIGGTSYIFAPVDGATLSYKAGGSDSGPAVSAIEVPATGIINQATTVSTIPANSTAKASTVEADVYVYFEGEDAGLKSVNLKDTLDTLSIVITFGIKAM